MYQGDERRAEQEFRDRPAESGIKINNIISALILGVMGWVGVNIEVMKKDMSTMTSIVSVHESRIGRIEVEVVELRNEVKKNVREISDIKGKYNGK